MTLREQLGKPILFHWVGWHGKDGSPSIPGYDSRNPSVITHQLKAMQALGGEGCGVIALTYGPTVSPFIHQAVMAIHNQCNALGMPFALCFDPWTVKTAPDRNVAMIAALRHPDIQFILQSDCYIPGRPVLDLSTGCSRPVILSMVPGIQYLMEGVDYDWVQIPGIANKTPLPCIYHQFNDGTGPDRNKSVWDQSAPARIIEPKAGATYWSRQVTNGPYVQFVTWNDYAEGTQIESFASMISNRI